MNTQSSRSVVTFSNAFVLSGYPDALPAGEYELLIEEERLEGLSFQAFRRTATFLMVRPNGRRSGQTQMRPVSESDLEMALKRDRALTKSINNSDAALSPREDLK